MAETQDPIHQANDALCRAYSADPRHLEALVRSRLPKAALARLADAPFRIDDAGFIDERLARHFADRLLFARMRDGRDLYVLGEFKGAFDPAVVEQLARYERLILQRHAELYPDRPRPLVLMLVLYSARRAWDIPHAARAAVEVLDVFGDNPGLRYLLVDAQREDPAAAAPDTETRSVLMALTWSKAGTVQDLRTIFLGVRPESALEAQLLRFLLDAREVDDALLEEGCYTIRPHLRRRVLMTHAQQWIIQERQAMLRKMLEKFFGPLSEEARQRIDDASPKQLESWALAVRDAQSVDDVLNGAAG